MTSTLFLNKSPNIRLAYKSTYTVVDTFVTDNWLTSSGSSTDVKPVLELRSSDSKYFEVLPDVSSNTTVPISCNTQIFLAQLVIETSKSLEVKNQMQMQQVCELTIAICSCICTVVIYLLYCRSNCTITTHENEKNTCK